MFKNPESWKKLWTQVLGTFKTVQERGNLLKDCENLIQKVSTTVEITELSDDAVPGVETNLTSLWRLGCITKGLEETSTTSPRAKELLDQVSQVKSQLITWVKGVLMSDDSFENVLQQILDYAQGLFQLPEGAQLDQVASLFGRDKMPQTPAFVSERFLLRCFLSYFSFTQSPRPQTFCRIQDMG